MKDNKLFNTVYIPDFSNPVEIPFIEETVPAGFPSPAENFKVEPLSLDRKFIRNLCLHLSD
ncbi:MAG: hypothetical protein LUF90_06875 [Rikenellaceae bacterium]|nr:hypothetical protein [Rikenellaceae bacterium]